MMIYFFNNFTNFNNFIILIIILFFNNFFLIPNSHLNFHTFQFRWTWRRGGTSGRDEAEEGKEGAGEGPIEMQTCKSEELLQLRFFFTFLSKGFFVKSSKLSLFRNRLMAQFGRIMELGLNLLATNHRGGGGGGRGRGRGGGGRGVRRGFGSRRVGGRGSGGRGSGGSWGGDSESAHSSPQQPATAVSQPNRNQTETPAATLPPAVEANIMDFIQQSFQRMQTGEESALSPPSAQHPTPPP